LRFSRNISLWVVVLFVMVLTGGCRKVPPAVPIPQPPTHLEEADQHFGAGNYPDAAEAFELYLDQNSLEDVGARVRFRLAMSYLIPPAPLEDTDRAWELLEGLMMGDGPYSGQAALILRLRNELESLESDLTQRDGRIRQLQEELEALKAIDMQRGAPPQP